MIVDCRTYTLLPRKIPQYLEIFKTLALPIQKKHFGDPVGIYVTDVGPQNEFIHMWRFDDFADMEKKRNARNAEPEWADYMKASDGLLLKQETKIIRGTNF